MVQPNAAPEGYRLHKKPQRLRKLRDGRVVAMVAPELGCYIQRESARLAISAATVVRLLILEAVQARGFTLDELKAAMKEEEVEQQGESLEATG